MNLTEIREKNISELHREFLKLKSDLTQEILNLKIGKTKSLAKKNSIKKTLARIKTIIGQKERSKDNEKA